MDRCEKCREFIYSHTEHKCDPKWLCRILEDDKKLDDHDYKHEGFEYEVYAYTAHEAATKIADREESNWDYSFVEDGGIDIDVKNFETGEVKSFYVIAESSIDYYAQEKK